MELLLEKSPEYKKLCDNYVDGDSLYVTGALALLLRLSRWVGVAPLHVRREGAGWRVTASPMLATLHRGIMTLLNVAILTGVILDLCQEHSKRVRVGVTFMDGLIFICNLVLATLVISLAVYAGPTRMESLMQVLKQWQQIKSELAISDPSAKCEKVKIIAIVVMMTITTIGQLSECTSYFVRKVKDNTTCIIMSLYSGSFHLLKIPGMLVVLQWCCTVLVASSAAASINENLLRLCHGSKYATYPSQAQATIRRLALSHERLNEMIREMSDANGWIVMAVLASTSYRLMLTTYSLRFFDNPGNNRNWLFVVIMFAFWFITHMTTLILMIEPCHRTHTQREHSKVLLSQLIVDLAPKCERLSKDLDQFANQLVMNNADFTPLGVYTLARPLMAMILGSITTYLVIIIQMHKVSNQVVPVSS